MTAHTQPTQPTQPTEVVVVGGGYAGVLAANRLTRRDDVAVTLVNPRPTFVERIRLHQLVGGSDDAVVDFADVLAERVRVVLDTVTRIDAPTRELRLESGDVLPYDYLVYAVGSGSSTPAVPGAAEHAFPLASLDEAQRLRAALGTVPATGSVTVVGAGPTGIETAAELAETGRHVTLVCGGELGPYLHPRGRRYVAGRLAALGVRVLDGPGSVVTAVTADAVRLSDGHEVRSDVTVWAAGFGVPDLARRSGLTTDALGRVLTDETLTSVDDERVVAAGDSASPSGLPFRMSCQAAVQLGPAAADTVLRRVAGRQPARIAVGMGAMCLSLGRRAGIYQFARRDDTAVGPHVAGRTGALVKELVCSGIVRMLALEGRHPGLVHVPSWVQHPDRRRALERVEAGVVDAGPLEAGR